MQDEETGADPHVNSASIADPYLLLVRDDSSVYIAQIDNYELEEVVKQDKTLSSTKWLTGCLYVDTTGIFAEETPNKGLKPNESILMFLLSASGALHVGLPDHHAEFLLTGAAIPSTRSFQAHFCG